MIRAYAEIPLRGMLTRVKYREMWNLATWDANTREISKNVNVTTRDLTSQVYNKEVKFRLAGFYLFIMYRIYVRVYRTYIEAVNITAFLAGYF